MIALGANRGFLAVAALLFAGSIAVTLQWGAVMPGMGGLPMPGGWLLSMMWLPVCGRGWPGAAASFLGMWLAMMAAMMLPSLVPLLGRYRQALGPIGETRRAALTLLVGLGYFLVWAVFGAALFPLGAGSAAAVQALPALARAVPLGMALTVLGAGALQFTDWKARHLACCRVVAPGISAGAAWRAGVRLGLHCCACSAGPTAILLAAGLMELRAMVLLTVATTIERLAPEGGRVARSLGAFALGVGLSMALHCPSF